MSYVITLETPVADYKQFIKDKLCTDEFVEDDVRERYFLDISKAAREVVWKLLFSEENPSPENLTKAAELLIEHKKDACYYGPDEYNAWIPSVRDELLRRKMVDFWREQIVKNALGPCWAMDSDLYDDMDDPEPANFYKHAGCVAPFVMDVDSRANGEAVNEASCATTSTTNSTPNELISLENPVEDYKKLVQEKLCSEELADDVVLEESFREISKAARNTVWKLLFDKENPTSDDLAKAGELLSEHKKSACFYGPTEYNEWIPTLRDELLKRKMYDFWREHIVKNELGICWARDSDYFDDMEDPEPINFYNYAGCVAPFASPGSSSAANALTTPSVAPKAAALCPSSPGGLTSTVTVPTKIGFNTPSADYTANLRLTNDIPPESEENLNEIFADTREVIWELLFKEKTLSRDNFQKAANLLQAYKHDACLYSPYAYNDWILELRDELFKRKYMDFWKEVIVDKECGLCWYKDSEFFDDSEDTKPIEFLKSGDALMAQEAKKDP